MTKPTSARTHQAAASAASSRYVPALRNRAPVEIAPRHEIIHTIDAPLSATQHVEMQTSATDRAKGFLIAAVPLYAAFAVGVLVLAKVLAGVPLLSFWGFATFWLSFVLAWVWGYRETLMKSPEGVAWMEANRKWDVIEEEQRRRWEHYDRLTKGD
jgi:fatty acid desaturase